MPPNLDPHLQSIIDNAGLAVDDGTVPESSFSRMESRTTQKSSRNNSIWSLQESLMPNDSSRDTYSYESFTEPPIPERTTSRLSLGPWNSQHRQESESGSVTNADQRFRLTQNLRQGLPVGREGPMTNSTQADVLDQLATNMLSQRPMPHPSPDHASMFRGLRGGRINQLHPQIQQVTPPFNQGGYVQSPDTQKGSTFSSPSQIASSSPTARVSMRRISNGKALPLRRQEEDYEIEEYVAPFETPRCQSMATTDTVMKRTPQALTLGHAPPMAQGIQLISPLELPDRFRQVFPYELFNAAQSKCFATVYKSSDNVVVSAPTGCGKTAILELAICKLVESHGTGEFKIVYQAPTRSLCSERVRDWQKKFSHLNLPCAELTGDTSQYEMSRVRNASIIVTTPEKWDSITRKWHDHVKLLQMVKLFLIDEVHILKDTRGATLEAVVSRMKSSGANVRFIALSATVPNSEDVAIWLGRDPTTTHLPAHRETFGEDFRPVKMQKHVYGFEGQMNDFVFDKVLDGKLPGLIQKHTGKKPIMVFCFTRKSCENTASILADWWTRQRAMQRPWPVSSQRIVVANKELQQLVEYGVAFHHAGLEPQDRNAIETAFLKGDINVICCTSTLAVGVNLPCHLVVLKGTVGFQDGRLSEYSDLEVMQMLGRAGRPQFDDSALAIIMTRLHNVQRYKKMVSGQEMLESTLHLNLIEHLNSEISLGTVYNLETSRRWLSGTFLSVRMNQNPDYYKLDDITSGRNSDERLRLVCERDVKLLQDSLLVTQEQRFMCTDYGHAMSRYMVQFDTMKLFLGLPRHAKMEQILDLICQASEFKDLRMKPNERPVLRELNKSPLIKYPIKENISTTPQKISLIIQVQLGGIDLPSNKEFLSMRRQFIVDKGIVFERIQRLVRCIIDCKSIDCDSISTRHALDLARSLSAEYWENSNLQLRQIPQIGPAASRKLITHNINSVREFAILDTGNVERIMSRNPPFGRKMLDSLLGFPCLTMNAEFAEKAVFKPGENPKVMINVKLGYTNAKTPVWNSKKPSLTFIAETSGGTLIHFWRCNIQKLDKGHELKFIAELHSPGDKIKCYVACDEIVGTYCSSLLQPDIPASTFPSKDMRDKFKQPVKVSNEDYSSSIVDEFGGDDFDDEELLEAVKHADAPISDYGFDHFADIDDLIGTNDGVASEVINDVEPVQLENGKWACNHHCRGGQALRNGQLCKHKCCHEGLDKPRKPPKKKVAESKTQTKSGDIKDNVKTHISKKSNEQQKLKFSNHTRKSTGADLEIVDLASDLSSLSNENLSPDNYHNKMTIPLPKQKPRFSYAGGKQVSLSFPNMTGSNDDPSDIGDQNYGEDFPSPTALLSMSDADCHLESGAKETVPTPPGLSKCSEAASPGFDDLPGPITLAPVINSSFENGLFDFSAFDDESGEQVAFSSPLMQSSRKRPQPPTPELPQIRCRRIKRGEEAPNGEEMNTQEDVKPPEEENIQQRSIPAWVDELDKDLIDGLKGIVDFID